MAAGILPAAEVANCNELVHLGLTTCHAVSKFGTQLVGNQVEVSWNECTCPAPHAELPSVECCIVALLQRPGAKMQYILSLKYAKPYAPKAQDGQLIGFQDVPAVEEPRTHPMVSSFGQL